jgi:hypothetical protein
MTNIKEEVLKEMENNYEFLNCDDKSDIKYAIDLTQQKMIEEFKEMIKKIEEKHRLPLTKNDAELIEISFKDCELCYRFYEIKQRLEELKSSLEGKKGEKLCQ